METALQQEPEINDIDKRIQELFTIFKNLFEWQEQDDRITLPRKNYVKVAEHGNLHKSARLTAESIMKSRWQDNDDALIFVNLMDSIYEYLMTYQEKHLKEASNIINGVRDKYTETI